ncbi:MAG: tRNA dihydrouridine synthase [Brevinematales bacterium]
MDQLTLRIGDVNFPLWAGSAPLAGFSHRAYRDWMRRWGAGFVVSEMISLEGLYRDQKKTWALLDVWDEPSPWVQLFGREDYSKWYTVVRKILTCTSVRLIDVNFGCPVRKVVKTGAGSALLRFPRAMANIIRAIKDAGAMATAKVRLGVESPLWQEFIPALAEAGVDAITVHGRYAVQFYSGVADWEGIREIRQIYSGVLIGNGDITSPEKAVERKRQTKVDGVMIGRYALGSPYIFRQIQQYLLTGTYEEPSTEEIKEMILDYASLYLAVTRKTSLVPIRATLLAMVHGFSHARHVRQALSLVSTYDELVQLLLHQEL